LYSKPTLTLTILLFLLLHQCLMMYSDSLYSKPTLNTHHTAIPITLPVSEGVQ
jgi:hypothetical protein